MRTNEATNDHWRIKRIGTIHSRRAQIHKLVRLAVIVKHVLERTLRRLKIKIRYYLHRPTSSIVTSVKFKSATHLSLPRKPSIHIFYKIYTNRTTVILIMPPCPIQFGLPL